MEYLYQIQSGVFLYQWGCQLVTTSLHTPHFLIFKKMFLLVSASLAANITGLSPRDNLAKHSQYLFSPTVFILAAPVISRRLLQLDLAGLRKYWCVSQGQIQHVGWRPASTMAHAHRNYVWWLGGVHMIRCSFAAEAFWFRPISSFCCFRSVLWAYSLMHRKSTSVYWLPLFLVIWGRQAWVKVL